jgi:hypothetical protein
MHALPSLRPSLSRQSFHLSSVNEPNLIRPFLSDDVPRVASLFMRVFRKSKDTPSSELIDYLSNLYLQAPWHDPECGSLVHIGADGLVNGFMGVIQLNMRFEHRFLRAGVMGAFMVEKNEINRGVGARLLRTYLNGPQDVFFSDTANQISLTFAQKLKFAILHGHSLEWIKVLQPSVAALQLCKRKWSRLRVNSIYPFARMSDLLTRRFFQNSALFRCDMEKSQDHIITDAEFITIAPKLIEHYQLKPDWSQSELSWLLYQARLKKRNGSLELHAVYEAGGKLLGCYVLYAEKNNIAYVLNMLSVKGKQEHIVGAVIKRVKEIGCAAVRGTVQPGCMEGLFRMPGVFYRHNGAMVAKATDPAIMDAIQSGRIFLGGLTGENWTRLSSDVF